MKYPLCLEIEFLSTVRRESLRGHGQRLRDAFRFGTWHPFVYPPTDYLFHLPCPTYNYPRRPLRRPAGLDHRLTSCPAFYRRTRCRSAPPSGIPVSCSSPHHLKHAGEVSMMTTATTMLLSFKTSSSNRANFALFACSLLVRREEESWRVYTRRRILDFWIIRLATKFQQFFLNFKFRLSLNVFGIMFYIIRKRMFCSTGIYVLFFFVRVNFC